MLKPGISVNWAIANGNATGVISEVVADGYVPKIAAKVKGPAALIEVWREGKPSGDFVGVPLGQLKKDRAVATRDIRSEYQMGKPSAEQLKLINRYIPSGAPQRNEDDTTVIPFMIADNLVNRSLESWSLKSLQRMGKLAPGITALLDHAWGDASKAWGRVFDAEYIHMPSAPAKAMDRAGMGNVNREIIKRDGYGQVIAWAFADAAHPVVRALKTGAIAEVSTGGFEFNDYICPHCNSSFSDQNCEHYIPDKYWGMTRDQDPEVASHAIRDGLSDLGEFSIVNIPNLPNAGAI